MTPEEVLRFASENGTKMVDLKFVDVPGIWQHFTVPIRELEEETFVEGKAFDGSSVKGFQTINESDMLLIPDPTTAVMDPFTAIPTLSLICNVAHPGPQVAKSPIAGTRAISPARLRNTCAQLELQIRATSVPKQNFLSSTMCSTIQRQIFNTLKLTRTRHIGIARVTANLTSVTACA